VTEDLGIEFFAVAAGGATAEEFFFGEELLVDLKTGLETESGVVARGHFRKRLQSHGPNVRKGRGNIQIQGLTFLGTAERSRGDSGTEE
jgi:hypothetical protein